MSRGTAPAGGEATVVISAPPHRVWSLISDIRRYGEWSPENTGGAWLDGTEPAVGARFRGTNRRGRTRWTTTCEVIAAVPGREFAFVTGSAEKPETMWRYRLEAEGDQTRVTESFELVKPIGAIGRLVTRMTTGVRDRPADLEKNVRVSLMRLKQIVEGPQCCTPVAPNRDESSAGGLSAEPGFRAEREPPAWSTWREAVAVVTDHRRLRSTLAVAVVVGTVLFCINQLDVVLSGNATALVWAKSAITYLVPFGVSNAGVLIAARRPRRGSTLAVEHTRSGAVTRGIQPAAGAGALLSLGITKRRKTDRAP